MGGFIYFYFDRSLKDLIGSIYFPDTYFSKILLNLF